MQNTIISSEDRFLRNIFIICLIAHLYTGVFNILYVGLISSYLMIAMGVYCIFKISRNKPLLITNLLVLFFFLFFYYIIGDKSIYIPYNGFSVGIYNEIIYPYIMFVALFSTMYYMGVKELIHKKTLIFILIIFIPFVIYKYIQSFTLLSLNQRTEVELGDITNNGGYYLVYLLPFLFLFKNKILSFVLLFGILYGVVESAKRGAIIITLLFALYYIYENYFHKKKSIWNVLIAIFFIVISSNYIVDLVVNNDYLYNRYLLTSEGHTSGRDFIMNRILSSFFAPDTSLFTLLFGGGIGQSIRYSGNWAHNDWLEFLTMSGFVGIFFYLSFYYCVGRTIIKCKNKKSTDYLIFTSCALMIFVKSFFSMSLFLMGMNIYPLAMIMGYSYANILKK